MQNTNVPTDWSFLEFGEFAFLSKDKYEPKANEHKHCIELEHIEKETGKLISMADSSTHTSVKNKFATDDVLFGKLRPYLKKYYKPDFEGVCSTEIWVLRGKQAILQEYLFLLIQSDKFISACNVSTGSRMPRADWSFVSETPFLLPPLEEQKKIAEILGTWDRAIEELTDLIAEKKELKRGLMQRLLTGIQRLPGFTKPWKEIILGDVADFYNGYMFTSDSYIKNGTYRIITIANVQRGFLNYCETNTITKLPADIQEYQILSVGDIIFSMTGNVGRVCTVSIDNCLLNQRVGKIVEKGVHKTFLLHILSTDLFVQKMISLAQGGAQDNISFKDVKKYKFNAPSDTEEQKAIADVLSKADSEIDLLNLRLDILKEQKRGLMQKLLTGEIRVKVDVE